MNKKNLGQFFTTNYVHILDEMDQPDIKEIIEPFAGNKDLINFLIRPGDYSIELFDIEPKHDDIVARDTIMNPPVYKNKYVITNPPFLARNKSKNKKIFDKYDQNDLYKCFIKTIIDDPPIGGIIIMPLNFWCSIRKNDVELRKEFLNIFHPIRINVFEERVFEDTAYSICALQFIQEKSTEDVKFVIYPPKKEYSFTLNQKNNYTIGGNIYNLKQDKKIKIDRLTSKNEKSPNITNIKLFALDNNQKSKIRLEICSEKFIDKTKKLSERTFATLIIHPKLVPEDEILLVKKFNEFIEKYRKKYNSMFLTNFRESSDIARKRISFSLAYKIINHLLQKFDLDFE